MAFFALGCLAKAVSRFARKGSSGVAFGMKFGVSPASSPSRGAPSPQRFRLLLSPHRVRSPRASLVLPCCNCFEFHGCGLKRGERDHKHTRPNSKCQNKERRSTPTVFYPRRVEEISLFFVLHAAGRKQHLGASTYIPPWVAPSPRSKGIGRSLAVHVACVAIVITPPV